MILAIAISGSLIVFFAIAHTIVALVFAQVTDHRLARLGRIGNPAARNKQPNVAVILSVRGFDPSLEKTITSLLNQQYDAPKDCAFHRTA